MTLRTLLTKDATIQYVRVVGKDSYGQPIVQTSEVSTRCYYRLQNTSIGDAVYQEQEKIRVVLPADTDLTGLRAVKIDHSVYEPAGVPHLQWNPRLQKNEYLMLPVREAKS